LVYPPTQHDTYGNDGGSNGLKKSKWRRSRKGKAAAITEEAIESAADTSGKFTI
jgi:hypothetical protein